MKELLCVAVFVSCMTPRFHSFISFYFLLLCITLAAYLFLKRKVIVSSSKLKDIFVFIIWLLVAIIQMVWSKNIAHSIWETYYLVVGALSVIIFNLAANDDDTFQKCFVAITLAFLIHSVIGGYEILSGTHLFEVGVNDAFVSGKPVSIFRNRNDYLTFMFVSLAIAVECINRKFKGRLLWLFTIGILVWGLPIILSVGSDTVILVPIVLIIAFLAVKISNNFSFGLLSRILIITGLFGILFALFFSYYSILETGLTDFTSGEKVRVNLILNGLYFLKETAGAGIGYGNTQFYLQYRSIYDVWGKFYFHNWYLETLVCGGVIVFVFYMIFHFGIIKRFFWIVTNFHNNHKYNDTDITTTHKSGNYIFASFLIFSVVCISSSSNFYSEWIWMYLGLVSAYSNFLTSNYLNSRKCLLTNEYRTFNGKAEGE